MLTCQQLTEHVTDYLEGRLPPMERARFQMHLGMCGRCRSYLRQMKLTVRTLGKLPAEPIPADVRDDLLARFRDLRPRNGAGGATVPVSLRALAAFEKAVGSRRGWALAGLIVFGALLVLFASGLRRGPLGEGARCLFIDLGTGGALVFLLGFLASANRSRLSPATFTVAAMTGSLAGFGVLQATCPMAHLMPHAVIFHVGGIVLAGVLGLAASRLPAFR